MRRFAILCLLVAVASAYFYPPVDASRLYLYPYWATNPRADVAHYPMAGYFALFGPDSLNSIRMWLGADTTPYFRLVTKAGDTVRFNKGGIYTTGDLWGKTVHYTTLDPPVAGGSPDTFKRGLGLVGRGLWAHSGESLAVDTAAMPHGLAADQQARDTAAAALRKAERDSLLAIAASDTGKAALRKAERDSLLAITALDTAKAAHIKNLATVLADTAIKVRGDSVGKSGTSAACTGNAATVSTIAGLTADTTAGGAARATLAANATNAKNADSLGHVAASGYVPKTDSVLLSISSGRVSWDMANGGSAFLTMTSNCTLNLPTNITPGRLATLTLIQDSTGSRLATWASGWKFCGDTATTGYATAAPTPTATGYPTYAGDVSMWLGAKGYMIFLGFSPAVLP